MNKRKRPYWQHTPCPEWCSTRHEEFDSGSDRGCLSAWSAEVTMTTMEPRHHRIQDEVFLSRPSLEVLVRQSYREVGPRVQVACETDEKGITNLSFTPGEALALIRALTVAVDVAEGHANPGGA